MNRKAFRTPSGYLRALPLGLSFDAQAPWPLAMFPQTYQQAQQEGMNFTKELEIYPGATRLRIIIRDATSGALGSVTIRLAKLRDKSPG